MLPARLRLITPRLNLSPLRSANPEEVLHAMGVRTAMEGVKGFYPAFDITPPKLVSAVVTAKGVFSPYDLVKNFVN